MLSQRDIESLVKSLKLTSKHRVATSVTENAIFDYLLALDCPRSLTVWLLFKNHEHEQLVDLETLPNDFCDPFSFRDAYAATHFLSKANFLKLDFDRRERALTKFLNFETQCKRTNQRFSNLSLDPQYKGSNVYMLNACVRKIDQILTPFSPEEFVESANWGPGVTTDITGCHVSAVNKFQSESGATRDLISFMGPWFHYAYPTWADHIISIRCPNGDQSSTEIVDVRSIFSPRVGNKVITVPKNSKIDRVIAVEPGLNLWFQKAFGSILRRRLIRTGIDLNSQERNQQLARLGSKYHHLATVDFSSASDSISKLVVRELLPPRWYELANTLRSKYGQLDDKLIEWEKFSSMGNGFTFELESLIFYAAALASCEITGCDSSSVSVYGDDVIIPIAALAEFHRFVEFLGFTLNGQKSFSSGPFRESCGAHYYDGVDCKPVYLKERVRNVQAIYQLANNVRRLAHRRNANYGCDKRFLFVWLHLRDWIPEPLQLYCPMTFGDLGLIGNFDEACPVRARKYQRGYFVLLSLESGVTQFSDQTGLLLARLKSQSIEEYGNFYTLRGRTRTRIARVYVPEWYSMGGWL